KRRPDRAARETPDGEYYPRDRRGQAGVRQSLYDVVPDADRAPRGGRAGVARGVWRLDLQRGVAVLRRDDQHDPGRRGDVARPRLPRGWRVSQEGLRIDAAEGAVADGAVRRAGDAAQVVGPGSDEGLGARGRGI